MKINKIVIGLIVMFFSLVIFVIIDFWSVNMFRLVMKWWFCVNKKGIFKYLYVFVWWDVGILRDDVFWCVRLMI